MRLRCDVLLRFPVIAFTTATGDLAAHARARIRNRTAPAKAVPIRVAPADEYFGRMKMSILGIRNQLHDLDLRLHYTPEKSEDVMGSAAFVEDALHDWEHNIREIRGSRRTCISWKQTLLSMSHRTWQTQHGPRRALAARALRKDVVRKASKNANRRRFEVGEPFGREVRFIAKGPAQKGL